MKIGPFNIGLDTGKPAAKAVETVPTVNLSFDASIVETVQPSFTTDVTFGKSTVEAVDALPNIDINQLNPFAYAGQTNFAPFEHSIYDGSKFFGGLGPSQFQFIDYWTLRLRSSQLFNENLYARGLIRRLITNEINTGLMPEATPDEQILGVPEDSLVDWTENTENRFGIWGKNPKVCDWKRTKTWGGIQRAARAEALISGDVLVVLRINQRTRLPMIQLVSGNKVQTPLGDSANLRAGHEIRHGVELDSRERVVAHWVRQKDNTFKRLPAVGEKSGRVISWLVYGTDKRLDDVRGQPLLSLVMQSLKEVDRYRDSVQRKAVINSFVAMFIKKGEDKMGTLPTQKSAIRKDTATVTDGDGSKRTLNASSFTPGVTFDELQTGEEPVLLGGQGTDVNFGIFEEAIVQAIAWANEIPPEILRLSFSNNYSASQAAINEFKIYLNKVWSDWGESFCTPIYTEWLISETLLQNINAPGLLEAFRDLTQYDKFGAWLSVEWYGSIKPSTDMLKMAKGSQLLVKEGWSTNAREARATTGTKFSKNAQRLKRENQLKADMMRPILELEKEFGVPAVDVASQQLEAILDNHIEAIAEASDTGGQNVSKWAG